MDSKTFCKDFVMFSRTLNEYVEMLGKGRYEPALQGMRSILYVMKDTMPEDFDASACEGVTIPGGVYNRRELDEAIEEFEGFSNLAEKASGIGKMILETECATSSIMSVIQLGALRERIEDTMRDFASKYRKMEDLKIRQDIKTRKAQ